MTIGQELAEAFLEHREAFGVPITFGETTIQAVAAETETSRELRDGGWADGADTKVKLLLSDLAILPSIGATGLYQERRFKVQSMAIQPGGLIGEYTLRPANR